MGQTLTTGYGRLHREKMPRIRIYSARTEELIAREYSFTVLFDRLFEFQYTDPGRVKGRRKSRPRLRIKNPAREIGAKYSRPD